MAITLQELARKIGAEVVGDSSAEIHSCGTLEEAEKGQVAFLANPRYTKQLETTGATAVVVAPSVNVKREGLALLKAGNPYYAFTQAIVLLHGYRQHPHRGIHPEAHVEPTATIGENPTIYPGVYVGANVRIGRDCVLHPNVVIYEDCVLGDRVIVHAGAIIGMDGLGFSTEKGVHYKIPQVGNVIIEDDVEVGAMCSIQRGTMGSTVIGKGTKFGDANVIGHGVRIGEGGMFVSQIAVAGSTTFGHHVTVAGQVGVAGHLKIGDAVTIAGQSGVMNNVPDQTTVLGSPAMEATYARKVYLAFTQLPELAKRVKELEDKVGELGTKDVKSPES
jgi:UDP-3-O-[3-hydroxymyristoyl] glucosamine N-acyltransferase